MSVGVGLHSCLENLESIIVRIKDLPSQQNFTDPRTRQI